MTYIQLFRFYFLWGACALSVAVYAQKPRDKSLPLRQSDTTERGTDELLNAMNRVVVAAFTDIPATNQRGDPFPVLVIGNSIARHGIAPAIGWQHESGMAASSEARDYVHLLHRRLEETFPEKQITLRVSNLAEFERGYDQYDFRKLDSLIAFRPKLIIFQLGENVSFRSPADSSRFQQAYVNLIHCFQKNAIPLICCTTPFFPSEEKKESIARVVLATHSLLADLSKLPARDPQNLAKYEKGYPLDRSVWKHDGIGIHPGDLGMANIADELFNTIRPKL